MSTSLSTSINSSIIHIVKFCRHFIPSIDQSVSRWERERERERQRETERECYWSVKSVTIKVTQIFQISGLRKINIANTESIFDQNESDIHSSINFQQLRCAMIYHYHDIYLRKKLFFEFFSEMLVFLRMNPP